MIRWTLFFLLFLLIGSSALCQSLLEGTIVDKETGKPVPFASIGIVGSSKGTTSNQEGKFSIIVPEHFSLKIICLGYAPTVVKTAAAAALVKLAPAVLQLDTMVITDKSSIVVNPKKVLRKAFSDIATNYSTQPFLQQFFYRHYCKDGDVYGRLIEAYVDVWKNQGYRSSQARAGEKEEIRVTQLRRSLDKTEMAQGHEPLSVANALQADIVGYQSSSKSDQLSLYAEVSNLKADFNSYTFTYKGITYDDNQEVYEIAYSYKEDSMLLTSGKYLKHPRVTGSLFVSTDTYAIVKAEDVKTDENNTITTSVYYRKYDGVYYPYHLVREGQSNKWSDESHAFHIELMSVDIRHDANEKFSGRLPDREELLKIPYDSSFWSTHTLLKTTPVEDSIISDLGGGISLNEQFDRYRQYEINVRDGGKEGEKKFSWLKENSKGNRILYLVFWSGDLHTYLAEMEWAKRLQRHYRNKISFVLLSLDDDENRWQQIVQKYTLYADGIINYRIGSRNELTRSFKVKGVPSFVLLDRSGEAFEMPVKSPNDPLLIRDLDSLLAQQ